jgi:hypothetical protein
MSPNNALPEWEKRFFNLYHLEAKTNQCEFSSIAMLRYYTNKVHVDPRFYVMQLMAGQRYVNRDFFDYNSWTKKMM